VSRLTRRFPEGGTAEQDASTDASTALPRTLGWEGGLGWRLEGWQNKVTPTHTHTTHSTGKAGKGTGALGKRQLKVEKIVVFFGLE